MNRLTRAGIMLVFIVSGVFVGCTKDTVVNSTSPDASYFATVVDGSDGTSKELATSDEAAFDDGDLYSAAAKDQTPPAIQSIADDHKMHCLKWGRYLVAKQRVITQIDMEGDSVAILHVQVTYSGNYVVYGTVDGVPDTVKKPFTVVMHRLFRMVRIAKKDDAKSNWRLDAVSILNGGTVPSKISITQMTVAQPTGDVFVANDPDAYFMHIAKGGWFMHDLPLFGFSLQVTITATVHSSDPDTDVVTLHYVPKDKSKHRTPMMMVSQSGDAVAGYVRTYSCALAVPANDKKFSHLLVSATTRESVTSTLTTDFSSTVWGLPYKSSE